MFCSQCGYENQEGANFCQKCGKRLVTNITLPDVRINHLPSNQQTAIWNPNAAAGWSMLFTPIFGSWLQMLNWRALGLPDKAKLSQRWLYASLGLMVFCVLLLLLFGDKEGSDIAKPILFLYLCIWYFADGRTQGKYIEERFGADYHKKSWGKVLLIAFAILFAYSLAGGIVLALFRS